MSSIIEAFKNRSERIDEWLIRQAAPSLEKNEHNLSVNTLFVEELEHIIHYLESSDAPRKIGKISLEMAREQAAQWTIKMNAKNKRAENLKETDEDIERLVEDGEYKWVKLLSQKSYNREGELMGHCVANYYQKSSKTVIYSLRDEENVPHCTIEMTGNEIRQIKGRGNKEVISKYHDTLRKFIQQTKIPVRTYDAWRYGWLVIDGNLVAETELPEIVNLTKDGGFRVGLSGFAKIPKIMRCSDVTIRDQQNLDLSKWEVRSSLVLENCRNVTLPSQTLPERLELINVKFSAEEKARLKEQDLIISKIKLVKTDLAMKSLTVGIIEGIENCSIYGQTLELKDQKELKFTTPGKIVVDNLKVAEYKTEENFQVKFKKLTVGRITLTDELVSQIDDIFLNTHPQVFLKTTQKLSWPAHWPNVFMMEMSEAHLKDVDFAELKSLTGLKVEYSFMLTTRSYSGNLASFLHDGEVLPSMQKTNILKKS